MFATLSCGKTAVPALVSATQSPFASFRDIPGVTDEEVKAIETLRGQYGRFFYGVNQTAEAFPIYNSTDNEVGGYAALVCEWLSSLFDIPFQPVIYDWSELFLKLESGEVQFTGDLMSTEERRKTYFMTDTIAERLLRTYQLAGSNSVAEIIKTRPPRLAVPYGFAPLTYIKEAAEYDFEAVFIADYADAHRTLVSGEADAFLTMDIAEPALDAYGDIVSETFYPLVFVSASLSTRMPYLEPVISVVQKALQNGGMRYLTELYSQGRRDYITNKFFERLTPVELEYMQRNDVVKIATESDSYPLCFYSRSDNEYQGIAFDVMREIKAITGLSFEVFNALDTGYSDLIDMLESGKASMITAMMRSRERERSFLLPGIPLLREHPVLVSKSEFPNVQFYELANVTVGIVRGTLHAELFKRWFPNNKSYREYDNMDSAFYALERGAVDMFMCMSNYLISIDNYKEYTGFKTNVAFDNKFDITFGFNRDEATLCSIVDKALSLIDLETISEYWIHKRYDYRAKVAEARTPWLIRAITLSLAAIAMMVVMFYRSRNEEKRLAKLVAEETSTLMAILNGTPDHIFCKDLDSRYTRYNKSFSDFYNLSGSVNSKLESDALGLTSDVLWHHKSMDAKVYAEEATVVSEVFVPSPDGKRTLFEVIKSPLLVDGKVTGLVGMARDITRRKAAEDEAKRASEAKSRFIANMSHEIRTPMNAILGITEIILRNKTLPPDVIEALNKIYNSGDLLLYIINDILDLSKIEAGKLELLPAQYEVASMINDTVALNTMRIGNKPIEFKLSVDENIPVQLFGDELRIRQILNNIISNAIKYTSKGEVTLSIFAEQGSAPSAEGAPSVEGVPSDTVTLVCCVRDTGQGMTEEQVSRLFEDYSRFNADANRTTEGTGLGMSITHNLVRMMNGAISVESEPDKGTTVTIKLPQGKVGANVLGKEQAEKLAKFEKSIERQMRKAQVIFEPMPYGSVLLVDDVESNLFVAEGLMFPYGLSIDTVSSGFEAIDKIKEKTYDIVFMDHMMPKMDGIETTKKIREMGYTQPIVALTANAIVGQSNIFMENGFDGYISKPIDIRQLNATLKKFVRDKQPPEVIEAANRNKNENKSGRVYTREQLAEIFVRDASRLAEGLEEIQKSGVYNDEEIRTYTINTHALKSALANIGETDLSAVAFKLEDAGRANDTAVIKAETPKFLDDLRAVIEKNTPRQEEGEENIVEDRAYLREKLLVIKKACEAYERKTIRAAIADLRQKEWLSETKELLTIMDADLLNGDFEAVSKATRGIV
jgi:PAS domain S-box-containing protein